MRRTVLLLLTLVILGGILRLYRLGEVPVAFFNDEAAVGYNAFSLLHTGKDEFGQTWPIFFTSFGEGKLPLYVYEAVPTIAAFGLNEFATRLPAALLGTLTILVIYFFTQEALCLSYKHTNKELPKHVLTWVPLWSAFFLATMPWHIHFSRGIFGQESLFWVLLGAWLSLRALRTEAYKDWILSGLSFSAALLTYHAPKAFVPLWIAGILLYLSKTKGLKQSLITGSLFLLISGSVWLYTSLSPLGMARAADMSVFSQHSGVDSRLWESIVDSSGQPVLITQLQHNKVESYGRDILQRYFTHFNPDFLFFNGDMLRARYRVPNVGQLLVITLPLLLVGSYWLFNRKLWPVILFLILSPLPAAFSFETPSSVRAIFMTVPLAICLALGWTAILSWLKQKQKPIQLLTIGTFLFSYLYFFGYYLDAYFHHAQIKTVPEWQYGYKDLVTKVNTLAPNYDKIKVTAKHGTPYIFFLFYSQYDPKLWQAEIHDIEKDPNFTFINIKNMNKMQFINEDCPVGEQFEDRVLYVCSQTPAFGGNRIIDRLYFPDGTENFVLLEKE